MSLSFSFSEENTMFVLKLDSSGNFVWAKAVGDAIDNWETQQ